MALFKIIVRCCIAIFLGSFSNTVMASAVISGTRIIYPSDDNEVSVKITNNGISPVLLQSWIDYGDVKSSPSTIKTPFILTPPVNRVDGGKGQTLRISYIGNGLPVDRESVFWLNVLEIPAKNAKKIDDNTLQVAFRSRIKIFFRPKELSGSASEAPGSVKWTIREKFLEANNPTPYFINFVNLSVGGKTGESGMISPFGSLRFNLQSKSGDVLKGLYVNDYGAMVSYSKVLK